MKFENKPSNKAMLVIPVDSELHIKELNGLAVVSSTVVAERFGKGHNHVLRDIENIKNDGGVQKWTDLFIPSKYQHPQNKQWYPEYLLTRDGFTLLAMGFTGQEALHWKLKYIEAFNKMDNAIGSVFNIIEEFKTEIDLKIEELKEQGKENHRPSHKTKLNWNSIIKSYSVCKGDEEVLKQMALEHFNATKWEDIPYDRKGEVVKFIRHTAEELKMFVQESFYGS